MKIPQVSAELYYVDRRTGGQTDMTKLTVTFRNFTKAPNKNYLNYRDSAGDNRILDACVIFYNLLISQSFIDTNNSKLCYTTHARDISLLCFF